jgi:hypothetical protein
VLLCEPRTPGLKQELPQPYALDELPLDLKAILQVASKAYQEIQPKGLPSSRQAFRHTSNDPLGELVVIDIIETHEPQAPVHHAIAALQRIQKHAHLIQVALEAACDGDGNLTPEAGSP